MHFLELFFCCFWYRFSKTDIQTSLKRHRHTLNFRHKFQITRIRNKFLCAMLHFGNWWFYFFRPVIYYTYKPFPRAILLYCRDKGMGWRGVSQRRIYCFADSETLGTRLKFQGNFCLNIIFIKRKCFRYYVHIFWNIFADVIMAMRNFVTRTHTYINAGDAA